MSEENFQSVKKGEKCLSVEFRVFEKKELEENFERKKIKVFLVEKKN